MAQGNFWPALSVVLNHEGGWSDHPSDPGGATMKGITLDTYTFFKKKRMTRKDLYKISDADVEAIYRQRYWDVCKCDELPVGVDLMVFDIAVNCGPVRARQFLQQALGVTVDGKIGPKTIAATKVFTRQQIISRLRTRRLDYYRSLKTFKTFGKGWTRRVLDTEKAALAME